MFENETQITRIKELAEGIVLTEEKIKHLEKYIANQRGALIFLMQQAGQTGVKLDSGLFPRLETKQRISKRKEVAADGLHGWLAKHDLSDIIKPTVHHGTLQTTLEGFIAAGNELPPEMFSQFEQVVVRMNGRTQFLKDHSARMESINAEKKSLTQPTQGMQKTRKKGLYLLTIATLASLAALALEKWRLVYA